MDERLGSRWSCPDGVVPISEQDLSCNDKVVKVACKNHDNYALACNPIDFVLAAGTVLVQQNLISWNEFARIDFRGWSRSSLGCKRQLIKPSELGFGFLKLSWCKKTFTKGLVLVDGCDLSTYNTIRETAKILISMLRDIKFCSIIQRICWSSWIGIRVKS